MVVPTITDAKETIMHPRDTNCDPSRLREAHTRLRVATMQLRAMLRTAEHIHDPVAKRRLDRLFRQVLVVTLTTRCHLRLGELAALTARDYTPRRRGSGRTAVLRIAGGKGPSRTVAVPADVADLLDRWLAFAGIAAGSSAPLLASFAAPAGARLQPHALSHLATQLVGIPAHALRAAALRSHVAADADEPRAPEITLTITIAWSAREDPPSRRAP